MESFLVPVLLTTGFIVYALLVFWVAALIERRTELNGVTVALALLGLTYLVLILLEV